MEMNIGPRLKNLLEQKKLSYDDLIAEFFRTVGITHATFGQMEGLLGAKPDQPVQDLYLAPDFKLSRASECRSLLERVLLRFRAQQNMDRHNAKNHPDLEHNVATQGIWIWALQESVNIAEHEGVGQGTALSDLLRKIPPSVEGDVDDEPA